MAINGPLRIAPDLVITAPKARVLALPERGSKVTVSWLPVKGRSDMLSRATGEVVRASSDAVVLRVFTVKKLGSEIYVPWQFVTACEKETV